MTRRSMKDLEMHVALLATFLDNLNVDQSRPDCGIKTMNAYKMLR